MTAGRAFRERKRLCTLSVLWRPDQETPWVLPEDESPDRADLGAYGLRVWIKPSDVEIPEVCVYFHHGARCSAGDGVLASQRSQRFVLEDLPLTPLPLLPMTRHTSWVVRNIQGVKHTNNLDGLYSYSDDVAEAARWLHSASGQQALRRGARLYGGGMLKLEPRVVGFAPVPQSFGRT